MTTYNIPCETFLRLAGIAVQPDEETNKPFLRCVRIEHRNNQCMAVAATGPILAGEFLGAVDEPDDAVCVTIVPAMLELARIGAALSENLIINQAPGWTVVTITSGTMYPGNGEIDGSGWPDWRTLLPADLPTKNNGCFSFHGAKMARLCASSPSGTIRCARNIDMTQPTIVRDLHDESWFGVFMVSDANGGQSYKPATIPEFLK